MNLFYAIRSKIVNKLILTLTYRYICVTFF